MRLEHLTLVDFRNYAAAELTPSPGANVFLGPNGAGKTNLLEAIHLVATGVSLRAGREQELVRSGCSAFSVRARISREGYPGTVECQVVWEQRQGKTVRRAGKALTGAARSGVLGAAVLFSPDDLDLVKGPPSRRRDFLDLATAKALPRHRSLVRRYASALAHRNRLLSDSAGGHRRGLLAQLEPWTRQLVQLGAEVLGHRLWALAQLAAPAREAYARLAGQSELLTMAYLPAPDAGDPGSAPYAIPGSGMSWSPPDGCGWAADHPPAPEQLVEHLTRGFVLRQADELARGLTLVGPHRDELLLAVSGAPLRVFGSQGQQRSAALALRLAENAYLRRVLRDTPLLLLDDVFSELDATRREGLLSLLRETGEGHQTFLSGTDLAGVPTEGFAPLAVFAVARGAVRPATQGD